MQLWVIVIFYYHSSLPLASSCLSCKIFVFHCEMKPSIPSDYIIKNYLLKGIKIDQNRGCVILNKF